MNTKQSAETPGPVILCPPHGLRAQPRSPYIKPDKPEFPDHWDDEPTELTTPGMDKKREKLAMTRPDHHKNGGPKKQDNSVAGKIRAYLKKNGPSYRCEISAGMKIDKDALGGNLTSMKKWKHIKSTPGQYGLNIYRLPDQEHVFKNNPKYG